MEEKEAGDNIETRLKESTAFETTSAFKRKAGVILQRESSPEVNDTEGQTLTQAIRHSQPFQTANSSSSSDKSFLPDAQGNQEEDPFSSDPDSPTPDSDTANPETPDLGHIFVGHPSSEERFPPVKDTSEGRPPPVTPTPVHRPYIWRKQSKPLSDSSLSPPVGSPYSEQRNTSQPTTAVKQTPKSVDVRLLRVLNA